MSSSDHFPRNSAGSSFSPIFVAGPDRSGTTLMYSILRAHPNISMTRRSNMWRYFHRRYGDLTSDENLERCLQDMTRYRKMGPLHLDEKKVRDEFITGERTYGRLFAVVHTQEAARADKRRWGDKSLHNEHFADRIFDEFPDARVIHMVRDPRDRYASVSRRHGQNLSRVGAATGRWLRSVRIGRRNLGRYPDRYMFVRYEDLATAPAVTVKEICDFIGEDFDPSMLEMKPIVEHRDKGGNSSFGDLPSGTISQRAVGRFKQVLSPADIAFIQLIAGGDMRKLGYTAAEIETSALGIRFGLIHFPSAMIRMLGSMTYARLALWRGARIPAAKMLEEQPGQTVEAAE